LVNGKVWPYLDVKKGKYRFRLLNGSNSRAYTLKLSDGTSFTQISVELGLLDTAVVLDSITLLPGERADIVVDFASYPTGTEIILENTAPAPFPGFPGVGVISNVLKFVVQNEAGFTGQLPSALAEVEELQSADADEERLFELFTVAGVPCEGPGHPVWTINGLLWDTITEFPVLGSTEIWTWHNQSGISHPMHMHLVTFQILDRQAINEVTGVPEGPLLPPKLFEKGWKDTAHSPPGYRTRVITRFEGFTGTYSYHCHILEHEDHEMMRQFEVKPCTSVSKTEDYEVGSLRYAVDCAEPGDTIRFSESLAGDTIILQDSLVITKDLSFQNQGTGKVFIGGPVEYLFTIASGVRVTFKNLALISGNGDEGRAFKNYGELVLDKIDVYDMGNPAHENSLLLNKGLLKIVGEVEVFSPDL
ncbi:MAG: multicopper oxidase domain-containing protein, partial [Saprospiraceae bacterium]|nr:multicopper oxidase domain-containing protein [Saprospiraceae bacterium]